MGDFRKLERMISLWTIGRISEAVREDIDRYINERQVTVNENTLNDKKSFKFLK